MGIKTYGEFVKGEHSFQKRIIDMIAFSVQQGKFSGMRDEDFFKAIDYIFKNAMINQFAGRYTIDKGNGEFGTVNSWKNGYRENKCKKISIFEHLLMSESAKKLVEDAEEKAKNSKNGNYPWNNFGKDKLHFEHITPQNVVYLKLQKIFKKQCENKPLVYLKEKIFEECFKNHKIILLTKEESALLDNKKSKLKVNGDIMKKVEDIEKKYKRSYNQYMKSEAEALVRLKFLSELIDGFKLYRKDKTTGNWISEKVSKMINDKNGNYDFFDRLTKIRGKGFVEDDNVGLSLQQGSLLEKYFNEDYVIDFK